jgi:hypothetical protein
MSESNRDLVHPEAQGFGKPFYRNQRSESDSLQRRVSNELGAFLPPLAIAGQPLRCRRTSEADPRPVYRRLRNGRLASCQRSRQLFRAWVIKEEAT